MKAAAWWLSQPVPWLLRLLAGFWLAFGNIFLAGVSLVFSWLIVGF